MPVAYKVEFTTTDLGINIKKTARSGPGKGMSAAVETVLDSCTAPNRNDIKSGHLIIKVNDTDTTSLNYDRTRAEIIRVKQSPPITLTLQPVDAITETTITEPPICDQVTTDLFTVGDNNRGLVCYQVRPTYNAVGKLSDRAIELFGSTPSTMAGIMVYESPSRGLFGIVDKSGYTRVIAFYHGRFRKINIPGFGDVDTLLKKITTIKKPTSLPMTYQFNGSSQDIAAFLSPWHSSIIKATTTSALGGGGRRPTISRRRRAPSTAFAPSTKRVRVRATHRRLHKRRSSRKGPVRSRY